MLQVEDLSDVCVDLASLLTSVSSDVRPWLEPWPARTVVVRGNAAARRATAASLLRRLAQDHPEVTPLQLPPTSEWPFCYPLVPALATETAPVVVVAEDLHLAFVNHQTNATRLVTTQPLYLLQTWLDATAALPAAWLLATVDVDVLAAHGPEALAGRGAWRDVCWIDAPTDAVPDITTPPDRQRSTVSRAFAAAGAEERLAAVGEALDVDRSPAHLLAMASVCMEANDLDNAGDLLHDVISAAPHWAAAFFERGKWCLRGDDMAGAAEAFGTASRLMPGFASAAANWGASLGELDRPEEALAAFRLALTADPGNAQALNNVGVVSRELGRLAESEAAFRQVISLTPELAFGHYNLGHTLFLEGRYQASLAAYQSGQQRDPARSPVQASRLALARLATGDAAGALRDLQGCLTALPPDYRRQVLRDTQSVAWALLSAIPDLRDWRVVGDWLAAELARS